MVLGSLHVGGGGGGGCMPAVMPGMSAWFWGVYMWVGGCMPAGWVVHAYKTACCDAFTCLPVWECY